MLEPRKGPLTLLLSPLKLCSLFVVTSHISHFFIIVNQIIFRRLLTPYPHTQRPNQQLKRSYISEVIFVCFVKKYKISHQSEQHPSFRWYWLKFCLSANNFNLSLYVMVLPHLIKKIIWCLIIVDKQIHEEDWI